MSIVLGQIEAREADPVALGFECSPLGYCLPRTAGARMLAQMLTWLVGQVPPDHVSVGHVYKLNALMERRRIGHYRRYAPFRDPAEVVRHAWPLFREALTAFSR